METNLNELFRINHSSETDIENSFERISKELLKNYSLKVNDSTFLFTEIEFYYFNKDYHEDINTHKHELPCGRWRCHGSGLDITFESNVPNKTDPCFYGGILIRGIKQINPPTDRPFVNGPLRTIYKIFNSMNDIMTINTGIFLVKLQKSLNREIYRTSRQGVTQPPFDKYKYRYFTELDNWDWKLLGSTYRKNIENDKDPKPLE